jgi:hypothetical protein
LFGFVFISTREKNNQSTNQSVAIVVVMKKNRYRDGIKDIIYTFLIYSYGFIFISFNNVLGLNFLLVNFLLYFFKLIKMGLSLLRVKNKNLWGER